MSPVVEAQGLSFSIRGKTLVDAASLALSPGELTVAIGPNGAGKSTLVRLLSGELMPSAGLVAYDGEPVARWPAWRLACKRAVLPQRSQLAFSFTVFEVARLGLDGVGRALGQRERQAIVLRSLARADVAHLAGRIYQTLSGGEQQRVHLARVFAQLAAGRSVLERQVLFLDEPTAGLDIRHQIMVLDAAAALAREGVAVFAVLHDINLAAQAADRLLVMKHGRVLADGAPNAVLTADLVADTFEVGVVDHEIAGRSFSFSARDGEEDGHNGPARSELTRRY